ncbi:preprotein translocase subunit SecG [Treponema parvum]|uniref:Protein-export membrane protein SecG n=1 Tax=Treponema parvum TaxID=138851 RepID=A0A975EZM9_9SPIR|nr:preprotein translocase subunit SecG [Treponema parvum]QTQ11349.1 preprotein translocase subunit SecG [Treponema parvum]QTQ16713.1 preprotein translocase subunit SecG [Treponema parvum]
MGVIGIILLVVFVIICILLVLLVLVQNEEGMGGLIGGGVSNAFGSHSANILTKTTYVLVTLFFITAFGLALLNKKPAVKTDLSGAAQSVEQASGQSSEWWKDTSDSSAK